MSLVLGVDVETTGLLPAEDRITEIGAVLYDWNPGIPVQIYSVFVIPEKPIPEEVTKLNGITDDMIGKYGILEEDMLRDFSCMLVCADYVMAHNAPFDFGFMEAAFTRRSMTMQKKLWLDTRTDIKYPADVTTRHLSFLAAEAGFVNPFQHRALFDVLTMLKIAEEHSLEDIVKRALEPTVYVQALVSFDEKELAKAKMFQWCGPKKIWWKAMKESDFHEEKSDYVFHTKMLQEKPE